VADDALSRRDFGKRSAGALLTADAVGAQSQAAAATPPRARRYAIVGVGHRSYLYQTAIQKTYAPAIELVAAADTNAGRLNVAADFARKAGREPPKTYLAHDFDKLVAETKPEVVIVTTVDGFHHEYICRAMTLGCDVITEKPMVTDEAQCRAVLEAEKKSGRKLTVAFNYRFAPKHVTIKETLMSGAIGEVKSVDFNWYLDVHHGADYFRRWHRLRKNSGSLLVHKASHHFDLVNWWLDSGPADVAAFGSLRHYGKNGTFRHTNCRGCPHQAKCP